MGLGKLGKLFFDEVEEENQNGTVGQQNVQATSAAQSVKTQSDANAASVVTNLSSDAPYTGKLSEQYAELLLSSINEANIPGPDFSELKAAFSSEDLKQNIPDVKTRWKTAFNMMKMMDGKLTKKHVLESIDVYPNVVDTELKNATAQFDKKYEETVAADEKKVKDSQKRIDDLQEHIRLLKQDG